MALIERQLDMTINKVDVAIKRIRSMCPSEGYWLATSKGKDSVVIEALTKMAGVKHEKHFTRTSVDPPELMRFAKQDKELIIGIPKYPNGKTITMFNLIVKKKMPPTRLVRYCCAELKESFGKGRIAMTGVRWAESANRAANAGEIILKDKKAIKLFEGNEAANFQLTNRGGVVLTLDNSENRRIVEQCYRTHRTTINPIVDWSDADVWEFIKAERVSYCELYDCGYKRIGCIGCPMNTKAAADFERYPNFRKAYVWAFDRMLEELQKNSKNEIRWKTGEEVMDCWLSDKLQKKEKVLEGQISMWDFMDVTESEFYEMYGL